MNTGKLKINIVVVFFVLLMGFIAFSAFTRFKKETVNFYEVTEGNMARNTEHKGIAVRKEEVFNADKAGYINFFVTSGKRVAVGTPVFSIDETGSMSSILSGVSSGDISLKPEGVKKLQKLLNNFTLNYNDNGFSSVYSSKASINTSLIDYAGISDSESLQEAIANSGINYSESYSPAAGVVSFSIDGFEQRQAESINEEDFNLDDYKVSHVGSGQLVTADTPVYKLVTDEEWMIIFPITDEEREKYSSETQLKIRFKGTDFSELCDYKQVNNLDGNAYGKLILSRYMVDFINDRYISFNIESNVSSGLKIPKSAVVKKTFLTIPSEYLTRGGDDTSEGFLKEVYSDKGTSIEYVPVTIYNNDDEFCYVDFSSNSPLQPGDYVVKPDSTDRYQLGATATLDGVYNINKGYAVFKKISVLEANDEYYTVRKNQKYGLSVYDHILFDPTGVNEGDFIYQ